MNSLQQLCANLADVRVLYVEDEDEVRKMTLALFSNIFLHVDNAKDGEEGLKLFKEHEYDLVISDIKMPKMNGRDMLRQINELNKDVVLMVISASDSDEDIASTVCDVYLHKPVKLTDFIDQLEDLQGRLLK